MGILGTPALSLAADNMTPDLLESLRTEAAEAGTARVIVKYRWSPERAFRLRERLSPAQRRARAVRQAQLATLRARLMNRLDPDSRRVRTYRELPFDALRVTEDGLEELLDDPDVESIHPDRYYRASLGSTTPLIGANIAHNQGLTGAGQTIVIADTGVRASHDFFKDGQGQTRIVQEACFSTNQSVPGFPNVVQSFCPNGQIEQIGPGAAAPCNISGCDHGTHVAGIAAGSATEANVSFNGVAPEATIIAVQVFSRVNDPGSCAAFGLSAPCPLVLTSDLIAASDYLIANANTTFAQYNIAAVNLSLGGPPETTPCDGDPGKANIDALRGLGIATVVAAGNGSSRTQLSSPACISTAVSVGATDDFDNVASFSNVATVLDLFAPGDTVTSSISASDTTFGTFSGTSMSAPHVTGAFAVLRQLDPDATVEEILNTLKTTGVPIDDNRSGGTAQDIPRIRLDQALAAFGGPDLVAEWVKLKPSLCPGDLGTPIVFHESAIGDFAGEVFTPLSLDVSSTRFLGSTFSLSQSTTITAIGGHFFSHALNSGTIFGALVVTSAAGLPSNISLNLGTVRASKVFTPSTGTDYLTSIGPVTLEAGNYALVFGSGQLGASGRRYLTRLRSTPTVSNGRIILSSPSLGWRRLALPNEFRFLVAASPMVADTGTTECRFKGKLAVANKGVANAAASTARIYYSGDTTLDPAGDIQLAEFPVSALAVNAVQENKIKLAVPGVTNINPNSTVYVRLDVNAAVPESNEANNIEAVGNF